jgi:enoyl-CoA hydratase
MDLTSYELLRLRRDGGVLHASFDRPGALNAFDAAMESQFQRFLYEVSRDDATQVVVLSGEGKAFSAGGDLRAIQGLIDQPASFYPSLVDGKRLITQMLDCPKPLIAKINGAAIGVGCTVALFCDVSFAAEHAKLADPHVAIGLTAGDGGAVIWPQLVGFNRAKEFLFTGEALSAAEAERLGLINHAVPADELDARVDAYARKLAAMPARALQWTKATINIPLKQLAASMMDASLAFEVLSNGTHDHREAVAALVEKRKPEFSGD